MSDGLEPTEEYDGTITVHLLDDSGDHERIRCSSYENAIDLVKHRQSDATVVKIEDRDDEIVFTSAEMDIRDWEREWKHAKRRLAANLEERACPYDSPSCFADDLCVRCQMDTVQENY